MVDRVERPTISPAPTSGNVPAMRRPAPFWTVPWRTSTPLAQVIVLVALMAAGPAGADQTDPRLKYLFADLRAADSAEAARPIEAEIWNIWMEAGDPATDRLIAAGVTAMNAGQYDLALQTFDRLVKTKPDFAEGWNKRATLLYLLGRYPESVADIAKVLTLEPRHFGALSGLALCDQKLGKDSEALQALQRAAAIYPNMLGLKTWIEALSKKVQGESI
jgi:tetratricopeptide (TPR) repeat protein